MTVTEALRRVAADNFPRRAVPADNAHDSLQQIVTSLPRPPGCPRWQCARQPSANRYFPAPPGIVTGLKNAQTKAPLVKGGWFGEAKPGGFRRQTGFHIGLYFKRVPAVNPSGTCGASSLWQGSLWDVPLHEPGGLYTCLPISWAFSRAGCPAMSPGALTPPAKTVPASRAFSKQEIQPFRP